MSDSHFRRTKGKVIRKYLLKKALFSLLKSPLIIKNPLYKYAYYRNIRNKIPKMIRKPSRLIIENTNYCNISCIFCPNEKMKRKKGIMKNELFESIINQCMDIGIEHAYVFGTGEPLLDPDYIHKITYAKRRGIKDVHCVTNGILLNESLANGIVEAQIDYLGISIDAASDEIYRKIHRKIGSGEPMDKFDQVVKNIETICKIKKSLKSKKPWIEIRFKDFEKTKGELNPLIKKFAPLVEDIGIYINVTNWFKADIETNIPKNIPRLVFPCSDLWSSLYITWEGRVALCCKDYECTEELGNLNEVSVADVWNGKRLQDIRECHLAGEFSKIPICEDCLGNTHFVSPWWIVEL